MNEPHRKEGAGSMRPSIKELCELKPSSEYENFLHMKNLLTEPVIIYGAGLLGRGLFQLCRKKNIPVAAVCDANLAGTKDDQFGAIESFHEAVSRLDRYQVVIASMTYRDEIERFIRSVVPDAKIQHFTFPLFTVMNYPGPDEYREFVIAHMAELEALADLLEDDKSRDTLFAVLKARLTWDLQDVQAVSVGDQYFPADVVSLSSNEVFYDCGAWMGDTLEQLIRHTSGQFKKAVCFEPGERQIRELSRTFSAEIEAGKVELIPECLSDRPGVVYFRNCTDTTGSHMVQAPEENDTLIQSTAIDRTAQNGPDVTFIKMDIEGAELAALKGAEKTILRSRPTLAICVYHKIDDLVQIPQYIKSLGLGYHFFLRHHSNSLCETVLYAV